jgi:hypothetical protein
MNRVNQFEDIELDEELQDFDIEEAPDEYEGGIFIHSKGVKTFFFVSTVVMNWKLYLLCISGAYRSTENVRFFTIVQLGLRPICAIVNTISGYYASKTARELLQTEETKYPFCLGRGKWQM